MNIEMVWDGYMYGLHVKTKRERYNLLCMGSLTYGLFTWCIEGTLGGEGEYGY